MRLNSVLRFRERSDLPYATGVSLRTVWSGHFMYGRSSAGSKERVDDILSSDGCDLVGV